MNGRGLIKRKLNYRADWKFMQTEPVAGNYYPVNSEILIRDDKTELAIVPDRAQVIQSGFQLRNKVGCDIVGLGTN